MQRAQKITEICTRHGWKIIVGVEPAQTEEISDFIGLQKRIGGIATTTGKNDPCYCGSGRKFKRCCDFS